MVVAINIQIFSESIRLQSNGMKNFISHSFIFIHLVFFVCFVFYLEFLGFFHAPVFIQQTKGSKQRKTRQEKFHNALFQL